MSVEDLFISGAYPIGAHGAGRPAEVNSPGCGAGGRGKRELFENRRRKSPGGAAGSGALRKERRRDCRHVHRALLMISVFNQGAVFEAQLINFSQDGLCAETDHAIRPGTSIYVRMKANGTGPQKNPLHPGIRTVALGEARWGRALGRGQPTRYRIGIRYYPPDY